MKTLILDKCKTNIECVRKTEQKGFIQECNNTSIVKFSDVYILVTKCYYNSQFDITTDIIIPGNNCESIIDKKFNTYGKNFVWNNWKLPYFIGYGRILISKNLIDFTDVTQDIEHLEDMNNDVKIFLHNDILILYPSNIKFMNFYKLTIQNNIINFLFLFKYDNKFDLKGKNFSLLFEQNTMIVIDGFYQEGLKIIKIPLDRNKLPIFLENKQKPFFITKPINFDYDGFIYIDKKNMVYQDGDQLTNKINILKKNINKEEDIKKKLLIKIKILYDRLRINKDNLLIQPIETTINMLKKQIQDAKNNIEYNALKKDFEDITNIFSDLIKIDQDRQQYKYLKKELKLQNIERNNLINDNRKAKIYGKIPLFSLGTPFVKINDETYISVGHTKISTIDNDRFSENIKNFKKYIDDIAFIYNENKNPYETRFKYHLGTGSDCLTGYIYMVYFILITVKNNQFKIQISDSFLPFSVNSNYFKFSLFFPMGLLIEDNKLLVSCGEGDFYITLLEFSIDYAIKSCKYDIEEFVSKERYKDYSYNVIVYDEITKKHTVIKNGIGGDDTLIYIKENKDKYSNEIDKITHEKNKISYIE